MQTKTICSLVTFALLSASLLHGQGFLVSLRVYLEGPFNGTVMGTQLNNNHYLPLLQPYNLPPWDYAGTEQVSSIPNADVVDWVLVEIRETAGDASTAYKDNVLARQAGFLLKSGNVVSVDGSSTLYFDKSVSYKLYAVVYHRNHLPVLSSGQLVLNAGVYTWDFTTGSAQAYGGFLAHKQIGAGVWGMTAGDGNANGQVNNNDKNDVWKPQSGTSGYKAGDFSMNGQVDNVDKNDYWKVNSGKSTQVTGAWSCGKAIADDRDGQIYGTVQIGTQCWMAKNLNTGLMIPGAGNMQNNGTIEKFCQGDNEANCDVYGGLYQWGEVMQYSTTPGAQGICPGGWYIPADFEYEELVIYLGGASVAGGKMKEAGTLHWSPPNTGATNSSGFTGLPGGFRTLTATFSSITLSSYFWTSSVFDANNTWYRNLDFLYASVGHYNGSNDYGFGLRCLKSSNQPPSPPSNPIPANDTTNQPINTQLSWTCSDPENDPLTFDVWFGYLDPPVLVSSGQSDTFYNPGALHYDTTCFWKIVVHDDHNHTTEGSIWSFATESEPWQCGDLMTDNRDGQVYPTVAIGPQCWMAKNLNIGSQIPASVPQVNNGTIEKYCYNDQSQHCLDLGGLYQWNEAMEYINTPGARGICPEGWHIPADEEWCSMERVLDAGVTCTTAGWRGTTAGVDLRTGGNSGFEALMAGYVLPSGASYDYGVYTHYWVSSINGAEVWSRALKISEPGVLRYFYGPAHGFSLRCVNDISGPNQPPASPANPWPENGADDIPLQVVLTWSCSDPENDELTYDVYFGPVNPPSLVSTAQLETSYYTPVLDTLTTHFWYVVAHDTHLNSITGPLWSFTTIPTPPWTCGDTLLDLRDNHEYRTVLIGAQCWMKENINIGTQVYSVAAQSDNGIIEKYCYANNLGFCDVYGGLYQWNEMMQYAVTPGARGICPDGWHVPDDNDWCKLERTLEPSVSCNSTGWRGTSVGTKLKAGGSSGFEALMAGYYTPIGGGGFSEIWTYTHFWMSSQNGVDAWSRALKNPDPTILRWYYSDQHGFSVRCMNDMVLNNLPPALPSSPNPPDGSLNVPPGTTLTWICGDPENGSLLYDVYFGEDNPPALVSQTQPQNTYCPATMIQERNYYWKIIAYDNAGNITEGPVWSFRTENYPAWQGCGDAIWDVRDGHSYSTVQIGTQCWMAENLNIGMMVPGGSAMTNNDTIEKYCYDNLEANCTAFGGLFAWNEMMQYTTAQGAQGICPPADGWHLPTDAEMCILEQYLDTTTSCDTTGWLGTNAGTLLKHNGGSGFEGLLVGFRLPNGNFSGMNAYGHFWYSTEDVANAWSRGLSAASPQILRLSYDKGHGFSVRCLKY